MCPINNKLYEWNSPIIQGTRESHVFTWWHIHEYLSDSLNYMYLSDCEISYFKASGYVRI